MKNIKCKKFNILGEKEKDLSISLEELPQTNQKMLKEYVVLYGKNQRKWLASTKSRSDGIHSGAKPHRQKGTGRARQGTLAAPQYKGGGRVHTPKPKFNQRIKMNATERRLAFRYFLYQKLKNGDVFFLKDDLTSSLAEPKTKKISDFFVALGVIGSKIICLGDGCENFRLSVRSLQKVSFCEMQNVSGYQIVSNSKICVLDSSLNFFLKRLGVAGV